MTNSFQKDRRRKLAKVPYWPFSAVQQTRLNVRFSNFLKGLWIQPVDATHWLNRFAGVSKSNVFRGRSFNALAMLLSFA